MEVCLPNGHQIVDLINNAFEGRVSIYSAQEGWDKTISAQPDMMVCGGAVVCMHCLGVVGSLQRKLKHLPHHRCNQQIRQQDYVDVQFADRVTAHWKRGMLSFVAQMHAMMNDVSPEDLERVRTEGGSLVELNWLQVDPDSMFRSIHSSWTDPLQVVEDLDTKLDQYWTALNLMIDSSDLVPNFMMRDPSHAFNGVKLEGDARQTQFSRTFDSRSNLEWGVMVYDYSELEHDPLKGRVYRKELVTPARDFGHFGLSHYSRATTPILGKMPAVFSGMLTGNCKMYPFIKGTAKLKTVRKLVDAVNHAWGVEKIRYALGPGGMTGWYNRTMQQAPIVLTPAALTMFPDTTKFGDLNYPVMIGDPMILG
ncbi:sigma 3 [Mammalian Orthoreovirus strain T3/Bat/Germany/342/08]|nr:sigma 3 [Mammalian Orthoreovirus strain T3/Bat/Germany/342/08]